MLALYICIPVSQHCIMGIIQCGSVLDILCSLDGFIHPAPVTVGIYTEVALVNYLVLVITYCFPMLSFNTESCHIVDGRICI